MQPPHLLHHLLPLPLLLLLSWLLLPLAAPAPPALALWRRLGLLLKGNHHLCVYVFWACVMSVCDVYGCVFVMSFYLFTFQAVTLNIINSIDNERIVQCTDSSTNPIHQTHTPANFSPQQ